ncbi:hypothetical protein GGR50DRAFT_691722 [Xylaria sp. CBS 124048]|nr:hypothetical protein GGR50DRAFT_691722 [Xylaria sp. CBS 124048]
MFFSPLKFLVFPFVFLFALPLALCAGITTILAFFVLFFQLFLVYFDVGLETLRYLFVGNASRSRYVTVNNPFSFAPPKISGAQSHRPSSFSISSHFFRHSMRKIELTHSKARDTLDLSPESSPTLTPLVSPSNASFRARRRLKPSTPDGPDGFSMVTPSIGLERDFEGVGGWRLGAAGVDDDDDTETAADDDERQWYRLNSRLESPYRPYHFRSQSGGAIISGPSSAIRRADLMMGVHDTRG